MRTKTITLKDEEKEITITVREAMGFDGMDRSLLHGIYADELGVSGDPDPNNKTALRRFNIAWGKIITVSDMLLRTTAHNGVIIPSIHADESELMAFFDRVGQLPLWHFDAWKTALNDVNAPKKSDTGE